MENQTLPETQPQVENTPLITQELPPQPAPNNKWLLIALSIISVVGIILSGILGYKYYQEKQVVEPSPTPTPVVMEKKLPSPTTDATDGWLTYENSSLGFKIKYPPQVEITKELDDENNRATIFKGDNLSFGVMLREKWDGFELKNYYYMDFNPSKEISLLDQTANIYEMPNGYCDGPGCSDPNIAIVFEHNSDVFHIDFSGDVLLSDMENQILSTFEFINEESDVVETELKQPDGWISHDFNTQNLTVYTPPRWQSSMENFPEIPSTLIRFWEAEGPENATIQLNIKDNWDNIGIGSNYTYFEVSDSIQAYRNDPPKMEDKKLDRYQTNFNFERKGKVYSLLCVHNWMEANIKTCESLLQTLEFND
jgi:hypothetical protein